MQKLLRWLGAIIFASVVVWICVRAFTTPWGFNGPHIVFGFYVAIALVVGTVWADTWRREGWAGVRARWAEKQSGRRAMPPRFYMMSLLTWIGVAVVLVVAFNLIQR